LALFWLAASAWLALLSTGGDGTGAWGVAGPACLAGRFFRRAPDERLVADCGLAVGAAAEPRLLDFLDLAGSALTGLAGVAGRLLPSGRPRALFFLESQTGSRSTIEPHLHRARWPISDSSISTNRRSQFEQVTENDNAISCERVNRQWDY